MRVEVIVILLLLVCMPVTGWSRAYGIQKISDGYIVSGVSFHARSYACLIKVNNDGNELWNKTYAGQCKTQAWDVIEVDGGYVLSGITGCEDMNPWIAKVDKEGRILWSRIYPMEGSATAIAQSPDGFVAALTVAPCNDCVNMDTWIVKFDYSGKELWKRVFDYADYASIKRIKRTSDGGYIGVGAIGHKTVAINYDLWILKMDGGGEEEWNRSFNFGEFDVGWDVVEVDDGYVAVGEAYENGSVKAIIVKLSEDGDLEWKKFFEFGQISSAWAVTANNGEVVISGSAVDASAGDANNSSIWMVSLNGGGGVVWHRTYSGNYNFQPVVWGVVRIVKGDDGYVIASTKNKHIWLGKVDLNGEPEWEGIYDCHPQTHLRFSKEVKTADMHFEVVCISVLIAYALYRFRVKVN